MDFDALQICCKGTHPEYVGFRFSCDGSWFSRKLILKILERLYILVTLTKFQPSGRGAAVRVQEYHEGGNGFNSCSRRRFFSSILYCII